MRTTFFVISQQKTASLAVYASLQSAFGWSNVYHVHWLGRDLSETPVGAQRQPASLAAYASLQLAFGPPKARHTHWLGPDISSLPVIKHRPYKKQHAALLALSRRGEAQCVVTLVRDPVARLYSDLFHKLADEISPAAAEDDWKGVKARIDATRDRVVELNASYYKSQFAPVGVDFTAAPVSEIGPARDGRRLLLLRVEDCRETFERAIAQAYGVSAPLVTKNTASTHGDPKAYQWLKTRFPLSSALIKELYADPVIRHAYSRAELDAFRAGWARLWEEHGVQI